MFQNYKVCHRTRPPKDASPPLHSAPRLDAPTRAIQNSALEDAASNYLLLPYLREKVI